MYAHGPRGRAGARTFTHSRAGRRCNGIVPLTCTMCCVATCAPQRVSLRCNVYTATCFSALQRAVLQESSFNVVLPQTYAYQTSAWGPCSATCGTSTMSRQVCGCVRACVRTCVCVRACVRVGACRVVQIQSVRRVVREYPREHRIARQVVVRPAWPTGMRRLPSYTRNNGFGMHHHERCQWAVTTCPQAC